MGSGKSTVGAVLAQALNWEFIDLDRRIVEFEGRSIARIFTEDGEAAFRRIESDALRKVLAITHRPSVIALGGGTYMQEVNRMLLGEQGAVTVYLEGNFEMLVDRCREGGVVRPLLEDRQRARKLLEQRRPIYRLAEFAVEVAERSPQAIADEIVERVFSVSADRAVPD
jgi:shikimate kinase